MPNAIVRAAATGLPSAIFNRRRMLLGLAAASSAAAAPVAVTAAVPVENAALTSLGDETPSLLATYRKAVAAREEIVKNWGPLWPALPKEIEAYGSLGEVAYDLEGNWPKPFAKFFAPDHFRERAAFFREPLKISKRANPRSVAKREAYLAKVAAESDSHATLAKMYQAERKRVRERSGIRPAQAAENLARSALIANVSAIMTFEPATMAGAVIQAEALEALSAVPPLQRGEFSISFLEALPALGERLAATILRIARAAS
jgi:hypothetical protein